MWISFQGLLEPCRFSQFPRSFLVLSNNELRLYSYQLALPNINVSDNRFLVLQVSTSCYFFSLSFGHLLLRMAPFVADWQRFLDSIAEFPLFFFRFLLWDLLAGIFTQPSATYEPLFIKFSRFLESVSLIVLLLYLLYPNIFWLKAEVWLFSGDVQAPCLQRAPHALISAAILYTLQRHNTEKSKQISPEKELRGLSPNFHIHVSMSNLCMLTIGLPILLLEIWGPILGKYKSLTNIWMWKLGSRPCNFFSGNT